jgi:hypothetical protein
MSTVNKDFKVKNGMSVGGNITLTGTVDSRDIQIDGTKLDTIDSSANNYTHPTSHAISDITSLQSSLDGKVDDSQVLTDVPSSALFTDTVYTHPTTPGNKHIPTGGSTGQFLKYTSSGTVVWSIDNNTTYTVGDGGLTQKNFTTTLKTKLDGIATGATADQDLSSYATTTYVTTQITNLVDSAPGALDTLNELAASLNDDANFAATVTTSLAGKSDTSHNHDTEYDPIGSAVALSIALGG